MPLTSRPFSLILTSFPNMETAKTVARTLVEEMLAACAHLFPAGRSIYRWEGKIEEADEVKLLIKTSSSAEKDAVSRLEGLHPYDTPEILLLDGERGASRYLEWLHASTTREIS